ncbi:MAG: hypothetical protein FJY77_03535, partial [Candidatus Altiarchaeales archaeon]|nr:hypothetical protein [Candidatus Altiarchaeales archaeon]
MKNSRIAAIAVSIICLAALTPSISAATLDELFSYNILGSLQEKVDVERLKVTDVDNNGMMDILVVTTGKPGTPNTELKNSVYVFNKDGTIRWRYKIEREIFASIIKDVNNDRNMETVVSYGLMQENIPRGTIKILDKNGALINQYGRTSLMRAIHVDDLNNDKYYELLAGSESRLTLQFIDGSRIWDFPERTEKALNNTVYSISTIDLDRDDEKEIVYGSSGVYLLSRYGKFICGYEVDTELDPLKRYVSYLTSARLSADGNPEIIAATNTNKIYALAVKDIRVTSTTADEKTYTANLEKKWVYEFHNNINSIQMYDLDKDSYDEILVANENGNMYALDNTGRVLWTFRLDDA